MIWCVQPALAEAMLPHVRGFLRAGYRRSGNSYAENIMLNELKMGRLALWVAYRQGDRAINAAMTTRIYKLDDGRKVCHICALGGRHMRAWLHYIEQIENYAAWEGCAKVRIEGREGWSRLLPAFVRRGVILEREVASHG